MNKKIFKRLLIATTMLSPIAIITPMILTSCNDNTNNGPGSTNPNLIKIGNFNNLLKTRPIDKTKPEGPKEFWLDVVGFHGNSFVSDINAVTEYSQIREFYASLIKDKRGLVESLVKPTEFKYVSDSNSQEIDYSKPIKLIKTNDKYTDKVKSLTDVFTGLNLSNIFGEPNDEKNGVGLSMKWDNAILKNFLSQVDVQCEIDIIDIQPTKGGNDNNLIIEDVINSSKYSVKYTFTPNGDNEWDNVTKGNEKNPLVITLDDYIDNVDILTDKLSDAPLNNGKDKIEYNIKSTLKKDDNTDPTTTDELVKRIKEVMSIDPNENLDNVANTPISLTDSTKITNLDSFITFINTGSNSAQNETNKLLKNNVKDALDNKKIEGKITSFNKGDLSASQKTGSTMTIEFSLTKKPNNGSTYFDWFNNFEIIDRSNFNIVFNLSFNEQN